MKKLMIIAGEASGDLHGGHVIQELLKIHPNIQCFGTGGDVLKNTGMELYYHVKELAVIGIWEVLKRYSYFKTIFKNMVQKLEEQKPDAVFLVDYVGFNLRFAKEAHMRGIPVIFYVAPQVWSWKKNRIHKMKQYIDLLLVLFPFEVEFFKQEHMLAKCFGHPLLDIVKPSLSKEEVFKKWNLNPQQKLVSLLPGSRPHEIQRHLPILVSMVEHILKDRKDIQFVFPLPPTFKPNNIVPYLENENVQITLVEKDTYNLVAYSDLTTVASGTATLETGILNTPMLVIYKTSRITYWIAKYVFKMSIIGLPNIVAGWKKIVPEMIQDDFTPENMSLKVQQLLDNSQQLERIKKDLSEMKQKLGSTGSYQKTATHISQFLFS